MAVYFNSDTAARAARIFRIVTLVASRRPMERLGLPQLAERCECTTKTILRDIKGLQAVQIPISYDRSVRSYVLPEKGWSYPLVTMTLEDALALGLARGLLLPTPASLPFAAEMTQALDKATAGLTPQLQSLLKTVTGAITESGSMARDYSRAPVARLLEAIVTGQTVEMLYDSRSSATCRRRFADPYRLDHVDGRYLHLQAWCHDNKKVCTFALDRIFDVRLTGPTFTKRPWNDSLEGVVGGMRDGEKIEVVVRFDSVVAPFALDRPWPFAATFEKVEDGSVVMRGVVQGVEGITRELLSWRRYVEVLGGPELRERVVEEVRAMYDLYTPQEKSLKKI